MLPFLEQKLLTEVARYRNPAVAFSAGIDSTLVLAATAKIHGKQCLAVMIKNEAVPQREVEEARSIADFLGCSLIVAEIDVLTLPPVARNDKDRCYHCKTAMLRKIMEIGAEHGCSIVLDGSNLDDKDQYRPGSVAAKEAGIASPLQNAGLCKTNVRILAKRWGLNNWQKPSSPCLLTRFPYHMTDAITGEMITSIGQGEEFLRGICERDVRLRWAGPNKARIEVTEEEMAAVLEQRQAIRTALRRLGFTEVTLDLAPYASGSFDRKEDISR